MVELGLPVLTDPGVCTVVETTVQATGFVGAGFLGGDGRNGRFCGRVPLAAEGHLMMVRFRVRSGADRTEGSLEWADSGIRTMTKSPAVSALDEANAFFSGGDDKVVPAIHEKLSNEVLHGETTTGVVDVEPHCP